VRHGTEIDIKTIPHRCDNKLLLPFMRDELRLKLLTPPIDGEVELDEDGSPPVIWAKAELSVPVVRFNYGGTRPFPWGIVLCDSRGREDWRTVVTVKVSNETPPTYITVLLM
jgi:hypothetical protein